MEARVIPARGWRLELLDVEPLVGGGPVRAVRGTLVAARATVRALGLVRRLRPRAVLSVGGYASGPVALAAAILGVPLAVLEPNSVVGFANRLLSPFAKRAYVAWEEAASRFRPAARRLYGVPLRAGFSPRPYAAKGTARVLVLGGSQGAAGLNERMPAASARLASLAGLEVIHQAGRGRDAAVREALRACRGARRDRHRIHRRRRDGHRRRGRRRRALRSRRGRRDRRRGEGRPLRAVPARGRRTTRRETPRRSRVPAPRCAFARSSPTRVRLADELRRLLADDDARVAMANAARALGKPDAAQRVAADLLQLAGIQAEGRVPARATNGAPKRRSRAQEAH